MGSRTPTAYIDDRNQTVALALPAQTEVSSARAEFRAFAVGTDYVIGAFAPSSGGLILFGRNRVEPLSALPPMRFEMLASLANEMASGNQNNAAVSALYGLQNEVARYESFVEQWRPVRPIP